MDELSASADEFASHIIYGYDNNVYFGEKLHWLCLKYDIQQYIQHEVTKRQRTAADVFSCSLKTNEH